MKKGLAIITFLLFIITMILGSGCSSKSKTDIKRPEVTFSVSKKAVQTEEPELPEGYADKSEYIIIEDSGIKVTVYFDLIEKDFTGIIENQTEADVMGISIEIKKMDGEVCGVTDKIDVKSKQYIIVPSISERGIFKGWTAVLSIDRDKQGASEVKAQQIEIGKRYMQGVLVNLGMDRNDFYIIADAGTKYNGEIYAGPNQTYVLTESNIRATIFFDSSTNMFVAKLENFSKDKTVNLNVTIEFENRGFSRTERDISLTPGEKTNFPIGLYGNPYFKIWRPNFFFNKGKIKDSDKKVQIIGDP